MLKQYIICSNGSPISFWIAVPFAEIITNLFCQVTTHAKKYINHSFKTWVSQENLTLSRRPSCLVTTLWSFFEKNQRDRKPWDIFSKVSSNTETWTKIYMVESCSFYWCSLLELCVKRENKKQKKLTCSGWTSKSCFIFLLADRSKAVCPKSGKQCNLLLTVIKNYSRCTCHKLNKKSMCMK